MPKRPNARELIEDIHYIDTKYGIDHNDCAKRGLFELEMRHRVFAIYGDSWYHTKPIDFTPHEKAACDLNRKLLEDRPPHQSFWHYLIREYPRIRRGTHVTINWRDTHDGAPREWQRKVAALFVEEFGDKSILYWVDW